MEHNYAIQNHTAERYLLEELPQDEREAYEEHFFSCRLCAEEVQAASEFIDGARELIQNQVKEELYGHAKQHSVWGSWLNWRSIMQPIPAMACVLLVFVTGFSAYQNRVTIPEYRQMASAHLIPSDTEQITLAKAHGEEAKAANGKALTVRFVIPKAAVSSGNFNSYRIDIVSDSGTRMFSDTITQEQANNPVGIFLAAGAWEPGKYFVVIHGVNNIGPVSGEKGELERLSFELERQK